uniref:CCR4-Not complex component Not1 C-terminal domain-containing protein n=1 Tax=Oryza glumipatula TaxID=40148 RepID=A0A0D9Z0T8_9ORYZ
MISEISATEVRLLLLQAAADSNLDSVRRRLCQLVDSGLDGCILLLQVCLDQVLLKPHQLDKSKHDLLSAVFRYCMDKTYFTTCFCEALGPMPATHGDGFLKTLSNVLELSPAERVGIGLALSDSEDSGLKLKGQQFSIAQIEGLCSNLLQSPSNDQIHDIVIFLHQTDGLSKHMDTFNTIISLFKTKETPFFAPTPFNKCDIQSRHLDMCFGSMDYDSELLLSEIEKEITMADIVTELGYGCTVDTTHCKEILSIFEPLDDVAVSKLVGAVIGTHNVLVEAHNTYAMFVSVISNMNDSPQLTTWNTDVLVDSINELAPSTNWVHVMENLDHEGFNVPDEAAFCLLMSIYAHACKEPFPLHAVCGSLWTNTEGQISFLKHAVSVPTDTFTFSHCSRKLAFPDLACPIQDNHAWFCLDLMVVLCQLAEVGHTVSVQSMLEYPLQHCPELLIVGLGHTAYNLLQYEVQSRVFPAILKDATKSNVVNYLWQINPSLTLRGFVDAHSDPDCLLRIVDVCRDLKILSAVLDSTPYAFSIKLAVAASRIDHSHLEKWLTAKLRVCKDDFLQLPYYSQDCVSFLKETMSNASCALEGTIQESQAVVMNIYREYCPHFIKILQYQSGHLLSNQKLDELRKSYISYELRNHDSVVRGIPTSDNVEIEADAYFHQMFSGQISIAAIVQMLSRFKNSPEKREQLIFKCMISNMFEEYKFLPKYPDKQLKLSALLFGSLIKHRLVTHLELGIALHAVLDALHKSVDSKMFMFGTTALEQFMDRLIEWPDYCNHILQISHLCGAHTEMVSAIERALARISSSQNELSVNISVSSEQHVTGLAPIEPIEASDQPSSLPSPHQLSSVPSTMHATVFSHPQSSCSGLPQQPSNSTGFGTPLNIGTLVAAAEQRYTSIESPPSEVQDKIMFMINNISISNMEAKAKECIEVLPECYYPWFAQSMVMKRASIEPNFHDLYLKFFVKVNSRFLNKEVLKATYENCKILLRSDLIKSSSEERSLLKNLGSWLGKFTIGRNQALLAKEIDPKVLIVEAYEKGLMIAVIPFTSKILEPCRSSIAYRPPNPWTMGILSLLAEIYNLPNLKMNLKFEIEVVLFKNLDVDLKDVNLTSLLKDRVCEVEGNPDFSNKDVAASQTQISSGISRSTNHVELQSVISSTSHAYATPHLPSNSMVEDDNVAFMMPKHVSSHTLTQVSPSETALASQSPFSLTQLVKLIPHDEIRCKISSKLGSLGRQLQYSKIMDTALDKAIKEILCPVVEKSVGTAIQNTKKLILKIQTLTSNNKTIKQLIDVLINDNLDLGCRIIKSVAMCKAIEMIDEEITESFPLQKKQREAAGSAYCDAFTHAQGRFAHEPEALRPKHEHLSVAQQVYEDYVHVWQSHSQHVDASCFGQSGKATCSSNFIVPRAYSPNSASATSSDCTAAQTAPFIYKLTELLSEELIAEPSRLSAYLMTGAIHDHPSSADVAYGRFVMHLQQIGVLMGDDITERFFHIFTELAVKHSLVPNQIVATGGVSQKSSQQLKISYFPIDSFSKLVAMVLKYSSAETGPNKCSLLPKRDSEEKKASFNPRPYFRLFISLLYDLISSDLHSDGANFQVLIAFANAFHALQPLRIPSWSCIQMRNVILDAHPQDMRVVDPASPNLKIDLLPEISMAPQIMSDVEGALKSKLMKTEVDEYFKKSEGSLFLSDLKQKLLLPQNETSVAGTRYNVPLINSLVLYVGIQGLQQQQTESSASGPAIHTAHMDIFRTLMADLDTEGRYLVLNAIANQLRYPNIHTHCFYFIILHLFSEATKEIIQDQIMRVILERLVVRRPHPWGLQMTLVELIKNPRYKLWSRPFIRCGPQIDKVLIEFVDMLDDPRLTSLYSSFRSIN